jgi:hypothetical protein
MPPIVINASERGLSIRFNPDWLAANPLTVADLEREREFLAEVGYTLTVA